LHHILERQLPRVRLALVDDDEFDRVVVLMLAQ